MEDKSLYTEDSIESLDPLTFTRLRPQVYCGDTSNATQLLIEIISNAIDEFRLGHGNVIDVNIDNTQHIFSVRDYGQGFIPNSFRDDGKSILEASFSVLNTSGKYREDGTYEGTSLGSFGIGSKLANFLSHWLIVKTIRNGISEEISFNEGVFENRKIDKHCSLQNGTIVTWRVSEEFFTSPTVEISKIKNLFKTLVCLCQGLTINVTYDDIDKQDHFSSVNGLSDLVDETVKNKEILKHRFIMNFAEGKYNGDMILTYTSNYTSDIVAYVNTGLTESGSHITQLKTSITREFNKFFRNKGWLKEKDDNLTGDDIQEGMYIIFNITVPNVAYDAQIKTRITRIDTKPFLQAFTEQFNSWLCANEKEIKTIADKAINARKAREAAKKARETIRDNQKKKEKKVLKFDSKLADCYAKDRSKCELIVVEGDSASGNLKSARNNEYQAVLPIRGKLLNCLKAPLDKIQKNAEIMTLIDALGLSLDLKNMNVAYDPHELRYGKIIILADSDSDGNHIRNLFYTLIWSLCPQLILDGHVYAGIAPLYKITTSKGYKYLKDDAALTKYETEHKTQKFTVTRYKGLGELSVDETEETLLDPENRVLKQITVKDIQKTNQLFEDLMGTAIAPRRNFIIEHSKEASYNV